MLLVAFQAEKLHLLLLPGCNHIRWATLALPSPSKSVRMMHDESQTGSSAALAPVVLGCVQRLSLLVAPSPSPTHEREWLDVLGRDHLAKHGALLWWLVPDKHPLFSAPGDVQGLLPTLRVHPVVRTHHAP
jgi:hypothetical protein